MSDEPAKRRRRSRFERSDEPPRFVLTERDKQVLATVNRYRLMNQRQLQALHFASKNTAQFRLSRLWQHGYLQRHYSGGFVTSEALYALDRKGAQLLQAENRAPKGRIKAFTGTAINPLNLAHDLALGDLRVSIEKSCTAGQIGLMDWVSELYHRADHDTTLVDGTPVAIIPDAFFVIRHHTTIYTFFLEFDRGTESLGTIKRKFAAYDHYMQRDDYKKRYRTATPSRVLFVVKDDPKRLERMHAEAKLAKLKPYYWFAHFDDVLREPLRFFHAPHWRHADREQVPILIDT